MYIMCIYLNICISKCKYVQYPAGAHKGINNGVLYVFEDFWRVHNSVCPYFNHFKKQSKIDMDDIRLTANLVHPFPKYAWKSPSLCEATHRTVMVFLCLLLAAFFYQPDHHCSFKCYNMTSIY